MKKVTKRLQKRTDHYFLIDVENNCYRSVPNDIVDDDDKLNDFIWEEFIDPCQPVFLVKEVKSFTHKFVPE